VDNIGGCPVMDFGQYKIGFDQVEPDGPEQTRFGVKVLLFKGIVMAFEQLGESGGHQ
jgi:hypothetical protein